MEELENKLELAFEEYDESVDVVECNVNRKLARIGVFGDIDDEEAEDIVESTLDNQEFFALSKKEESREESDELVTVINFRIR